MQQLDFFIAPAILATKTRASKPAIKRAAARLNPQTPAPEALTVAEQLNRGIKVTFPKDANAVRVSFGTKSTVILKADADTLKGAGVATVVEFGTVKNDARGHPIRKNFTVLPPAKPSPQVDFPLLN